MPLKYRAAICIAATMLIISCHKRYHPSTTSNTSANNTATTKAAAPKTTAATTVKKPAVKKTPYVAPKVIAVNDSVAKKSIDGRLYYDLLGYRYWRNYNDGKYYLFNKSMFTDSAFKPH
jgi:hypothetical protein